MSASDAENVCLDQNAQSQLKSIAERVERVEAEQADLAATKKEIYAEASGNGFDKAAIRKVVARRKKDRAKAAEEDAIFELYCHATGDL